MKQAVAGTLESSDVLITISEGSTPENTIAVDSIVKKQFGAAIEATIKAALHSHDLRNVHVHANDKGALDCTIQARLEAAANRYKELTA